MNDQQPTKRCDCDQPKPRVIDDHTLDCEKCGGWFAVSISTPEELDTFFQRFRP